jgi:hypothetical protein
MVCFQTKNSNLGKFSRALCRLENGYILWSFGIFSWHLGYFMTIWYILSSFRTFFTVLVSWTNKNRATLVHTYLHISSFWRSSFFIFFSIKSSFILKYLFCSRFCYLFHYHNMAGASVTRLGKNYPIGWLFTLGSFCEN